MKPGFAGLMAKSWFYASSGIQVYDFAGEEFEARTSDHLDLDQYLGTIRFDAKWWEASRSSVKAWPDLPRP